jgi:hypothetical protein
MRLTSTSALSSSQMQAANSSRSGAQQLRRIAARAAGTHRRVHEHNLRRNLPSISDRNHAAFRSDKRMQPPPLHPRQQNHLRSGGEDRLEGAPHVDAHPVGRDADSRCCMCAARPSARGEHSRRKEAKSNTPTARWRPEALLIALDVKFNAVAQLRIAGLAKVLTLPRRKFHSRRPTSNPTADQPLRPDASQAQSGAPKSRRGQVDTGCSRRGDQAADRKRSCPHPTTGWARERGS